MSKLKVDNLEAIDQNVTLIPKGTGVVKVKGAGGADGTVQLTSADGTNGVKIKSPPHSAGQDYTMILPDNNIETGKFLKVKSVSGSGTTATGQLEYASVSEPDLSNLNASNFTSGTVPSARFPSTLPGSVGAYELVQKQEVTQDGVISDISFSLTANTLYSIMGKHMSSSNYQYVFPDFNFYNSSNQNMSFNYLQFTHANRSSNTGGVYSADGLNMDTGVSSPYPPDMIFRMQLSVFQHGPFNFSGGTGGKSGCMGMIRAFSHGYENNNLFEAYFRITGNTITAPAGIRFHWNNDSNAKFSNGSQILMYKYNVS